MNPILFKEYAPEINDLLNDCAGMGIFYPKYYGFSWSNLMNPQGQFYTGSGATALTSANSTSPKPLNFVTKPGESFICTTIYVSWSAVAGGGGGSNSPNYWT